MKRRPYTRRPNPPRKPQDLDRAIKKYMEFQDLEPKETGRFGPGVVIPPHAYLCGRGIHIAYRSDKWGERADYIHHFKDGVRVCRIDEAAGRRVPVPQHVRKVRSLALLGQFLELRWEDPDGEVIEATVPENRAKPELYTIPSGKALVVIERKRQVAFLIWGGRLGVIDRGIIN